MVITFDNVDFKYVEKKLLDGVSFSITDTDKIGVIGYNGVGKSTMLKLIMEYIKPTSGKIIKSGGMKINYLAQDNVFPNGTTIISNIMKLQTKEHPIMEYEAKSILSKLGLDNYDELVDHLSGGQRKRLALAQVLLSYCDMLILDEPTNHLDNELIMWLEKYLTKWKKGLLMVTHDRYFLERICTKMIELDFGKVYLYDANYSKFLELKSDRMDALNKYKQKLKGILKQEKEWMNRGVEARRTKSKARIERFNDMSKINFDERTEMKFESINTRLGKELIEITNGMKAFGDNVLFRDFYFQLQKSDIIGIVGDNGAGKTTLFKILMKDEELTKGEIKFGQTLNIGYFSQMSDITDLDMRVIDYIKDEQNIIETLDGNIDAKGLLERFAFSSLLQYSKISTLSGGEKRRLQLVKVLIKNPNVLILDEPTNDLDIYTLEILEDYLLSFKGPILAVSHDRYFLDKICNKLFAFEDGYINQYLESFSEYIENHKKIVEQKTKVVVKPKNKLPASIRNEYNRINEEIEVLEKNIESLKLDLSKETTDYHKIMELSNSIKEKEEELDIKITRLFELEEIKQNYE